MKIIAYFLPQFHEIIENNEWWGEGFTEWTNIKKAKTLYSTHEQPIKPLGNYYYNLLEKETMIWQTKLLEKYKIEGLCYYHYWFEGKKLLEQPAENLLKWTDIQQKFCFCWANHTWRKTWNGTLEVLQVQNYGEEKEWDDHIKYLLPFFKDQRYIKIDGKPLFMIYDSLNIPNLEKRMEYYNEVCKKEGIDGIYFITSLNDIKVINKLSSNFDSIVLREPNIAISGLNFFQKLELRIKRRINKKYFKKPTIFDDRLIYKKSLEITKNIINKNSKIIIGSFNKWDSTPRHEKNGFVIENKNIDKFKKYLLSQKRIMIDSGIEYMFFNAWNEWAEGMYLEPDEKNGYKYLEIVKEVVETEV